MSKAQLSFVLLAVAVYCLTVSPAAGLHHIVGGSIGWTVPPNVTYFQDWAQKKVIGVGDKLLFPFRSPLHNIVEVGTQDDFDHCTQNALVDIYTTGPFMINYTAPGDHYYFSGIGKQCESGLKLHVTVVNGKGSSGRILPPPVTPAADVAVQTLAAPAPAPAA
ncbi:hypothetical protein NMG60_11030512 [Bertholletia excelsa]